MVNKYFGGNVPNYTGRINDVDADLEDTVASKITEYENNMEDLHFSNAIESIWGIISRANKYIDETAPWTLAKQEETEKLESVIAKMGRDESVHLDTIVKICIALQCNISDIVELQRKEA